VRQLRRFDRRISPDAIRALIEGRREEDVRRALAATRRERPADPLAFFTACLGRRVALEVPAVRRGIPAVKRGDDGYPF
jgi:hypothetical protein